MQRLLNGTIKLLFSIRRKVIFHQITAIIVDFMKIVKVPGPKKTHKVFVYALSTCAWCKKTKKYLEDNGIEYEYVDVDRCNQEDLDKIKDDILKKGSPLSFPLIIVDEKTNITGYREDKLQEALEL